MRKSLMAIQNVLSMNFCEKVFYKADKKKKKEKSYSKSKEGEGHNNSKIFIKITGNKY